MIARKPLGASVTSVLLATRTAQLPMRCNRFLIQEKCSVSLDRARADHHVGFAGQDRGGQLGDVRGFVLVVGVGIDDDVRAQAQAGVKPVMKAVASPRLTGC